MIAKKNFESLNSGEEHEFRNLNEGEFNYQNQSPTVKTRGNAAWLDMSQKMTARKSYGYDNKLTRIELEKKLINKQGAK